MSKTLFASPVTVKVRAIDVRPYRYGLWCRIENDPPFTNPIVHGAWSDDGQSIWFGLDSFNFYKAAALPINCPVVCNCWAAI